MSVGFAIYLLSIVDSLGNFVTFLAIVCLCYGTFAFMSTRCYRMEKTEWERSHEGCGPNCKYTECDRCPGFFWHTVKRPMAWIVLGFILGAVNTLTPNSKGLAAIYLVPKFVTNERVQQLPDKALDMLNLKMDQWVNDLKAGEKK